MTCSTRLRSSLSLAAALLALTPVVAAAAPADKSTQAAKDAFARGQKAYTLARFEDALAAYTEAYELKPIPEFLFNIAQCHRQLGNFERAAFFYRRFLSASTKPPKNEDTVKELLAEMESKQAALEAKRKPEPPPPPPPPTDAPVVTPLVPADATGPAPELTASPPLTHRWYFWTGLGAVVVAGAVTGVVLATRPPALTHTTLKDIQFQ